MRERIEHLYVLHPHFVGRDHERAVLTDWWVRSKTPVIFIEALGGAGKSALAWVWLHHDILQRDLDVHLVNTYSAEQMPEGVFWWSFYAPSASFRAYLAAQEKFFLPEGEPTTSVGERLERILEIMASERHLVVLDGLERILLAYAPRDPSKLSLNDEEGSFIDEEMSLVDDLAVQFFRNVASRGLKSRVLCTTRLLPSEVKVSLDSPELLAGISHIRLGGLHPEECLDFFQAAGIECHLGDVRVLCEPVNYHPLYVRLISGFLSSLPPNERGDLSHAARFFDGNTPTVIRDRVLQHAYFGLPPSLQLFLSRLSALRTIMSPKAVEALAPKELTNDGLSLPSALSILESRGLLWASEQTRSYDLHPVIRTYAYSRLGEAERKRAHEHALSGLVSLEQLEAILSSAAQDASPENARVADHFSGVNAVRQPEGLDVVASTIEIFYQLVGAGRVDAALTLYRDRLSDILFFTQAAYFEAIVLLEEVMPDDEDAWKISRPDDRAWALNALAMAYSRIGLLRRAKLLYSRAIQICREHNLRTSLAVILQNWSEDLLCEGKLQESEVAILESRAISVAEQDQLIAGLSYRLRGFILNLTGRPGGYEELESALKIFQTNNLIHPQVYVYTNIAWGLLLEGKPQPALQHLDKAEVLAGRFRFQRDLARISFLRGMAARESEDYATAIYHLQNALAISRNVGLIEFEPNIMIELARALIGMRDAVAVIDARRLIQAALRTAVRSGFLLQECDAHLAAAYAALGGDWGRIMEATPEMLQASLREIERCIELAESGGEAYTYRRAYHEAEELRRHIISFLATRSVVPRSNTPGFDMTVTSSPVAPAGAAGALPIEKSSGIGGHRRSRKRSILHLSDLHFDGEQDPSLALLQLSRDLREELDLSRLDALIVSGDIANSARAVEYQAAAEFVVQLLKSFSISPEAVLFVPGNHDVDWDKAVEAYKFVPKSKLSNPLEHGHFVPAGETGVLVRDPQKYLERFANFRDFHNTVLGRDFPLEVASQATVVDLPGLDFAMVGFNSAWQCDHHFPDRAEVNPHALATGLSLLERSKTSVRIAVWHHPVTGPSAIPADFLELLSVSRVRFGLHGHIHEVQKGFYEYDENRGLHLVGAGTFGAAVRHRPPGVPWQYNLLTVDPASRIINVATRRREKALGAWSADARWGDKRAPLPSFSLTY